MDTNTTSTDAARAYLADCFSGILSREGVSLEEAEDLCIGLGHSLMARALAVALERLDARLCAGLADGVRVHDRRERTLAAKMGDVTFRYRRCRDGGGATLVPLAEALGAPWGSRVSPAAASFLVEAGAEVSFQRSARLPERAGGSRVSAVTAMRAVHGVGALCAEEDARAADSLFDDGVVPEADCEAAEICPESDGTWFRLQQAGRGGPRRAEVKALVAYAGKARAGAKTGRVKPVRHGCVASPADFWREGVAAVGTRFDLAGLETCHMGSDGEGAYMAGGAFLPCDSHVHLDPFHVNRAVLSRFPGDGRKLAGAILAVAIDGDARTAATMIDICAAEGLAKAHAPGVAGYLRNNADAICSGGPGLGTMEAEQQHVYGCRMDGVPCAWTREGADAMARIRSRICSKRALPRPTRASSATPGRRRRAEARRASHLASEVDTRVPLKVGHGREAEHVASVAGVSAEVRYAAGVDSGMVAIGR